MRQRARHNHESIGLCFFVLIWCFSLTAGISVATATDVQACSRWGTGVFSYTHALTAHCLSAGMSPHVRTETGETPVMWAAWQGYSDTVTLLRSYGADLGAENNFGTTVLIWAAAGAAKGQDGSETVKTLLLFGANPNIMDMRGVTALTAAAAWGANDTIKLLLQFGADPNAKDKDNMTALMGSAMEGHSETVRLLLVAGADPNVRGKFGTAAQLAEEAGHSDIARLLRKR